MAASDGVRVGVNFVPLTPISFLERAASVHPHSPSVIYGLQRSTWRLTLQRCKRLATGLRLQGILPGDVVSVIAPNVPEMYEAHFGVPMSGAVLNAINTRLDTRSVARMLHHGGAKALIVHADLLSLAIDTLLLIARNASETGLRTTRPQHLSQVTSIVIIRDANSTVDVSDMKRIATSMLSDTFSVSGTISVLDYEELLMNGDPEVDMDLLMPSSENAPIALNYTSGTTSSPKGVVYTHRGAFLNAISSILMSNLSSRAVYLWTLPMFHCNGWCFPWAVAALSGTNVCLKQVDVELVFRNIVENKVDFLCGAPTVLTMMISARDSAKTEFLRQMSARKVKVLTGGAPPPAPVLGKIEELGFQVVHTYGLTETYGPATVCEWKHDEWDHLPLHERAKLNSRQGVRHLGLDRAAVLNPETMEEVPWDGETIGEVMFRGNTVMSQYFNDPENTAAAFAGGWYHSGDLGVVHPDGYIQLKDRSKDIIISGGENISTIQVENVLYQHPEVLEAAVAAMPDEKWGETPCAFVTLKREIVGEDLGFATDTDMESSIKAFCQENLPRFMAPTRVVFGRLPKTSTGKIQKFKLREVAKALAGVGNSSGNSAAAPARSKL